MPPSWPPSLPNFTAENYARKPGTGGARFDPDLGPGAQRRRTRAAPWRAQYALKLTASQLETFWAFWQDDCQSGALRFTMIDPIDGAAHTYWFVMGDEPEEGIDGRWHTIVFRCERAAAH